MFKLNKNQRAILLILGEKGALSSSGARGELTKRGEDISLVTVKRLLAEMKTLGLIESTGAGRAVTYTVSSLGRMFATPNAAAYCALEPDKRYGAKNYNFWRRIVCLVQARNKRRHLEWQTFDPMN